MSFQRLLSVILSAAVVSKERCYRVLRWYFLSGFNEEPF